jgi:hypothetical protein
MTALQGQKVYLAYDHDEAGSAGLQKLFDAGEG